ncbi:MAG: Enoyl-CoA hydratase/isomerase [Aeromicrobium sp.]|jgi:enoyl-CoA hydratase|nr:Enoyl-CoA hydratase/isomerase [Aeromicrobium sp.]
MSEPDVRLAVHGRSATVTLSRPERLNALREETLRDLESVWTEIESMDDLAVVVIKGEGRAFSAGADVNSIHTQDVVGSDNFMRRGQAIFTRINTARVVTVAAVHGYALGGGLELAMACDTRVAARSAVLGHPESTLGHLPGWGGTHRLPALVGRSAALELIVGGERISAERACGLGLVDLVVDDVELDERVDRVVDLFLQRPTEIVHLAKEAVLVGDLFGPAAAERAERVGIAVLRDRDGSTTTRQKFLAAGSLGTRRAR